MDDVSSDITPRYKQIRIDLALDAEVPRILRVCSHVRRHRQIRSVRRKEGRGLVVVVRKRISTRIGCPRIIEIDAGLDDRQSERRYGRGVEVQVLLDEIMSNSTPDADCCFPVASRIPGESDARIEVFVVGLNAGFAIEVRITRVSETGRRVGNDGALLVRIEFGEAEVVDINFWFA